MAIPAKIKCGRCSKNLPHTKYSTKQLTDLRYQISQGVREPKPINCHSCTGNQLVEIECTMCHKTKGLEEFAKCQRKPDTAVWRSLPIVLSQLTICQKCYKCTEDQVTHEPVNDDHYERTDGAFVTPDHSGGHVPDYWTSASSTTGSSAVVSIPFAIRVHGKDRQSSLCIHVDFSKRNEIVLTSHRVITTGQRSMATRMSTPVVVSPCPTTSSRPCPSTDLFPKR